MYGENEGDVYLFRGRFRYYQHEERSVRALVHLKAEHYDLVHPADLLIVPIQQQTGERTAFTLSAYILEQQILVLADLAGPQAGRVVGSELDPEQPVIQHICGFVNGWYYPADQLTMLWDCKLLPTFRDTPLTTDANLRFLWQTAERWSTRAFPGVERIATPFRDLTYPDEEYWDFLGSLGYKQLPQAQAAFGKQVDVSPQPGQASST